MRLSKVIEESDPPTGLEPAMLKLGSFDFTTSSEVPPLREQPLACDAVVGGVRGASGQEQNDGHHCCMQGVFHRSLPG